MENLINPNRWSLKTRNKKVRHPEFDNEAVVKPEDQIYRKEDADFDNAAKKREEGEQPVHPVSREPKK